MPSMTAHIREGVPRDHELMERIDGRRTGGDNRTPILRELLWLGVVADDTLSEADIDFDGPEDREEFVAQAISAYIDSMDESDGSRELAP